MEDIREQILSELVPHGPLIPSDVEYRELKLLRDYVRYLPEEYLERFRILNDYYKNIRECGCTSVRIGCRGTRIAVKLAESTGKYTFPVIRKEYGVGPYTYGWYMVVLETGDAHNWKLYCAGSPNIYVKKDHVLSVGTLHDYPWIMYHNRREPSGT